MQVTFRRVRGVGVEHLTGRKHGRAEGREHEQADLDRLTYRHTVGAGSFLVVAGRVDPVAQLRPAQNKIGRHGSDHDEPKEAGVKSGNPLLKTTVDIQRGQIVNIGRPSDVQATQHRRPSFGRSSTMHRKTSRRLRRPRRLQTSWSSL